MSSPGHRLLYLANIRIPSEKAHVLQIFKNCEAFSRLGLSVELWYPRRRRMRALKEVEDVFDYYQVERVFTLRQIACPDIRCVACPAPVERIAYVAHSVVFTASVAHRLRQDDADILYTRDPFIATGLALRHWPFVFELHTLPESGAGLRWMRYVLHAARGIIVTTQLLADDVTAIGVGGKRVLVAPDGVDGRLLDQAPDQGSARARLGISLKPPIAAYVGHLYRWKGSDTLVACAERMSEVGFLIVGGTESDIRRLGSRVEAKALTNVHLAGHVPPCEVPYYLSAADLLLLPNTDEHRLSARDTSPMKAFEYMASGRPIVASDLPSLREIFRHEANALLVPPGDAESLRLAMRRLLDHPELGERLAESARRAVTKYTWDNRARWILDFAARVGPSEESD
jgi:glycosyltransferase involved in cell wall biosynthesis